MPKLGTLFLFLFVGCFDIDPLERGGVSCPLPVASAYDRDQYFEGWIDADGDGEDTRFEVLVVENVGDPGFDYSNGRKIFKNPRWLCPYSGETFTDPSDLDIDHLVPLKEAWVSGACYWTQEQRIQFNNYLTDAHHLLAVKIALNRQKSDQDPVRWLPPNPAYRDQYILNWARIKANWGLSVDPDEYNFLRRELGDRYPPLLKMTTCPCQ